MLLYQKHIFSVSIVIHHVPFVSGSQLANFMFPLEDFYDKGPKHWHEYVKAHLFNSFRDTLCFKNRKLLDNLRTEKKTIASFALNFFTFVNKYTHIPLIKFHHSLHVLHKRPTLKINMNKSSFSLTQIDSIKAFFPKRRTVESKYHLVCKLTFKVCVKIVHHCFVYSNKQCQNMHAWLLEHQ